MTFIEYLEDIAKSLEASGWQVHTPERDEADFRWESLTIQESIERKKDYIDAHLNKIKRSTIVLIANYPKNGVDGYIGANSLMEASFAYALNIPVYFLFPIGEQACKLEAESIVTKMLNGRLHFAKLQ
ncbi:MAG: hypothetical protein GY805_19475 [Chloroflexi bacterium]|nr:hypothetical protein [Chloroflexota bacterium]